MIISYSYIFWVYSHIFKESKYNEFERLLLQEEDLIKYHNIENSLDNDWYIVNMEEIDE